MSQQIIFEKNNFCNFEKNNFSGFFKNNFYSFEKKSYLIILSLIFFSSVCANKSTLSVAGSIKDSKSNFISYVNVEIYEKKAERRISSHSNPIIIKGDLLNSNTSNSLGAFSISGSSTSTGCASATKDAVLVFTKTGYKKTQITVKSASNGVIDTKVVMQAE